MMIFKANKSQKPTNQKTPRKNPEQPKKKTKTKTPNSAQK